jgi:predicted RNA-binding protein with TRAM domain
VLYRGEKHGSSPPSFHGGGTSIKLKRKKERNRQSNGSEEMEERRGFRELPAPVKEGETYTVKIDARGKSGDGLARVEGFVVFVPGANVGDEVKVRITSVRRKFATAEIVTE